MISPQSEKGVSIRTVVDWGAVVFASSTAFENYTSPRQSEALGIFFSTATFYFLSENNRKNAGSAAIGYLAGRSTYQYCDNSSSTVNPLFVSALSTVGAFWAVKWFDSLFETIPLLLKQKSNGDSFLQGCPSTSDQLDDFIDDDNDPANFSSRATSMNFSSSTTHSPEAHKQ